MIRDKNILIKNIYYMLSYAFQSLKFKDNVDMAVESFEEMYDLLAAILAKGIGIQLKQGLYKEYISKQERLTRMRGKINMPETIKNRIARQRVLTCDFDELSENNLQNQILKTTILLLLKHSNVNDEFKDDLKKKILYFSNVDVLEIKQIKWGNVRFQRNYPLYRMLIGVCQLIVEGMLTTTEDGEYRLASFVDEQRMCMLYQNFILQYYATHYGNNLEVYAPQIKWDLDDGYKYMLPVMQSDIQLQLDNNVLIIDAKYYSHITQQHFDKQSIRSGHLYQIFTYVKNKDYWFGDAGHKVSGMLLYAKTVERIQPDNVYQMHGNQISVKTLDLNKEFAVITQQLDQIVQDHFGDIPKS